MNTRSSLMVELLKTTIASSVTSTASGSVIDMGNYFPVGKREVKVVLGLLLGTTSTGFTGNITLQESTSTTTTDYTNVTQIDGTTVTKTNADASHALTEFHAFIKKRYVKVIYNSGQATTGNTLSMVAAMFPIVREF